MDATPFILLDDARHDGTASARLYRAPRLIVVARRPEEVVRRAVRGMLPRNRLGESMSRRLHVYKGAEHPHGAQKPEKLGAK